MGQRAETMISFLGLVREKYGSAEGYCRTVLGFGDEKIKELKAKILGVA